MEVKIARCSLLSKKLSKICDKPQVSKLALYQDYSLTNEVHLLLETSSNRLILQPISMHCYSYYKKIIISNLYLLAAINLIAFLLHPAANNNSTPLWAQNNVFPFFPQSKIGDSNCTQVHLCLSLALCFFELSNFHQGKLRTIKITQKSHCYFLE